MSIICYCRDPKMLFAKNSNTQHASSISVLANQAWPQHRREKSNHLGKSINGLIVPNEYKLDLITSPILFVDILDSQISANNVSAGLRQRENTIWFRFRFSTTPFDKEDFWSKICFKIKSWQKILHSKNKGVPFTIHPAINMSTWD